MPGQELYVPPYITCTSSRDKVKKEATVEKKVTHTHLLGKLPYP